MSCSGDGQSPESRNIGRRWAAIASVSAAVTLGDVAIYEDQSGISACGVGGRFLFRRQNSLCVGFDVAR